jgi:uncharacterized ion transporter superfamily protein YfcC
MMAKLSPTMKKLTMAMAIYLLILILVILILTTLVVPAAIYNRELLDILQFLISRKVSFNEGILWWFLGPPLVFFIYLHIHLKRRGQ